MPWDFRKPSTWIRAIGFLSAPLPVQTHAIRRNARFDLDAHLCTNNAGVDTETSRQFQLVVTITFANRHAAQHVLLIEALDPTARDSVLITRKTLQKERNNRMFRKNVKALAINFRSHLKRVNCDPRLAGSVQVNRQNLRIVKSWPAAEPLNDIGGARYIGGFKHALGVYSVPPDRRQHERPRRLQRFVTQT